MAEATLKTPEQVSAGKATLMARLGHLPTSPTLTPEQKARKAEFANLYKQKKAEQDSAVKSKPPLPHGLVRGYEKDKYKAKKAEIALKNSQKAKQNSTEVKPPKPPSPAAARRRFKGKYAGPDKYKGRIPPHLRHKYKGMYFGKEANKGQ